MTAAQVVEQPLPNRPGRGLVIHRNTLMIIFEKQQFNAAEGVVQTD